MLNLWNRIERELIGWLAATALLIATYQIAVRYFFPGLPTSWTGEIIIYLIVWSVFIAASLLVHEDGHVRADLILRLLSLKRQRAVEIFNTASALVFCLVLAYYGVLMTWDSYDMGERSVTALRFPLWIYYAALPTGFALMTLRYIHRLYLYIFRYDETKMAVHSGRES